MLIREAQWVAKQLATWDSHAFPLLNVGSHTANFREREQPWIDRYLFAPLRQRGCPVVHSDLQDGEGIDLVGDLTLPEFLQELRARKFGSVICTNLLEHVPNRDEIARSLVEAVKPGGRLLVTCPQQFPYHPDPIDTLYRPTPDDLASLFPGTRVETSASVSCGTLLSYLFTRLWMAPRELGATLYRRRRQVLRQTEQGISTIQWAPWLVKNFKQACVVLRKL